MTTLLTRAAYGLAFVCLTWAMALLSAPPNANAEISVQTVSLDEFVDDPYEVTLDDVEAAPEPAPAAPMRTYDIVVVRALVTACSPEDAIDQAYYARHGYEGSTYNIAADLSVLPRNTRIRVPGYMDVSYPDKFWRVDSAGGSIIRRATRRGIIQFDVKYRTEYSALKWGSQWLDVEIQVPRTEAGQSLLRRIRPHVVSVY